MSHSYSQKNVLSYVRNRIDDLLKSPKTLKDIYEASLVGSSREKASIWFDEDGKLLSVDYAQYAKNVEDFRRRLISLFKDIDPQGVIALKYRNSPAWPYLFWGIVGSGHPILLVDGRLSVEEASAIIKRNNVAAVFSNDIGNFSVPLFRMQDLRKATPSNSMVSWSNTVYFSTSGTTGEAKTMMFTGNELSQQIAGAYDMPLENFDIIHPGKIRNFAMIPFHHIFGFVAVFLWYTFFHKTIVYPSSASTKDLLHAIKKGKVTHLYSVPLFWDQITKTLKRTLELGDQKTKTLVEKHIAYTYHEISKKEAGIASWRLVEKKIKDKVLGPSVIFAITGGGYAAPETLRIINGIGYPLHNGYGMTEIGVTSVDLNRDPLKIVEGSIGRPLHGMKARLTNDEKEGELLMLTPALHKEEIIKGVRGVPDTKDGYYATGDIATIADDGSIFIKGRLKDIIISNDGENVYPDEIESYFLEVKGIPHLVCFGVQEGTEEHIVLVLEALSNFKEEELEKLRQELNGINAKLSSSKKVTSFYLYDKAMPLANGIKAKRALVKEEFLKKSDNFHDLFKKEEKAEKEKLEIAGYDASEINDVVTKVRTIFAKTLVLAPEKIKNNDVWDKDLGGDSMSYVAMVSELNETFNIEIPLSEYGKAGTVIAFSELILRLLHQK